MSSNGGKQKPPSHAFRKGTDEMRLAYRRGRAAAMGAQLERLKRLAAELADEAVVTIPRDDGYAIVPPGAVAMVPAVIEAARETLAHADLVQKRGRIEQIVSGETCRQA